MGENVNRLAKYLATGLAVVALSACVAEPEVRSANAEPERLIIHPDGSMEFRDRPVPEEDVVIYEDGFGGERAAIKINLEPLHPPFYRDTIVVERR